MPSLGACRQRKQSIPGDRPLAAALRLGCPSQPFARCTKRSISAVSGRLATFLCNRVCMCDVGVGSAWPLHRSAPKVCERRTSVAPARKPLRLLPVPQAVAPAEGPTFAHYLVGVGSPGVCGLKEVHLLHFNFDTNELECAAVYSHPHEVCAGRRSYPPCSLNFSQSSGSWSLVPFTPRQCRNARACVRGLTPRVPHRTRYHPRVP
jgi:hypothetical protein